MPRKILKILTFQLCLKTFEKDVFSSLFVIKSNNKNAEFQQLFSKSSGTL